MSPSIVYGGAILTGGHSRRMGTDKALLVVDGRPMAVRVGDALWEGGCRPVWCQGGDAPALESFGFEVVPDEVPGQGPLPGVVGALRRAGTDVVVAACDLVDLDAAAVTTIVGAARERITADPSSRQRPSVAVAGGDRHLFGYWPAATSGPLAELLEAGERSYLVALERLGAIDVAVPDGVVRNVNTPGDLSG